MVKIAKVVVDVSLNQEFDYLVPDALEKELTVGSMVRVPFGRRKARGYIVAFADHSEYALNQLKPIESRIGKKELVEPHILELAKWISDYYACTIEQALKTVLPSAVRKKGASFKEQVFVSPTALASDLDAVTQLRKRAPRQAELLDILLQSGNSPAAQLLQAAGTSSGTLKSLEEKGFVVSGRQAVGRNPFLNQTVIRTEPPTLMEQQVSALAMVQKSIETHDPSVVLLFGVTGSGKTEVYLQAIDLVLARDQGAIVLVPEIALTPQTVERFRGRFGDQIAVLHSSLSEGERHDEWHRVHEGKARIVVGARSALFAPVKNLGLIIVDEEHEATYKQDEAPRYNARDVAVMRGHMESCSVLLGSATPSLESYQNTIRGKYALASMPHRVDHQRMPAMKIVDMRQELKKEKASLVLSEDLKLAINERLARSEQTLLFLNRRGYSTSLVCKQCGFVAECEHCSVALTYHRKDQSLRCHLCGAVHKVPAKCPECSDPEFKYSGAGTQRVEDVISRVFKGANVFRMDSDSMTRKGSYREVLGRFRTGKIDILIGTQMIAKGLHFPNVTLVGVISADAGLHMPDFRAGERTFQLLTQVAGRAGRGEIAGEVIVQTFTPFHPSIQAARRLDYEGFFDQESEFRRQAGFPPFGHLVCMTVRGEDEDLVDFTIGQLAKELKKLLPADVKMFDPCPAPIARVKGEYRYQVIMTASSARNMTRPLRAVLDRFKWPKGIGFSVDVDALTLL